MKDNPRFDDGGHRLYRFSALMDRLTSPTWSVIKTQTGFIFCPTQYRNLGRGRA